ncbi:MAG: hypothetical protein JWM80_4724 [Cyanobacteria bacterium RYN_339]|nr:hypothetical protein [Cyanobacteria bacterium RYN_339]
MYLKALSDDEKQAFLELAYLAARADRILALEEYELWRAFRWELGLPDDRYSVRDLSLTEAAAVFKSDRSRRIALVELIGLVMADGVEAPAETGFVQELAGLFGLDGVFVDACFAWVKRHGVVMAEGRGLVDGDPAIVRAAVGH